MRECLNSLIDFKSSVVEIICVDDGSTDETPVLLDEYAEKDGRIKVFHRQHSGRGAARNYGISQAQGDYLTFVDNDDYVLGNYYPTLIEAVHQFPDDALFAFDFQRPWGIRQFSLDLTGVGSGSCNKLFKRELWNQLTYPVDYWYEDLGVIPVTVFRAAGSIRKIDKAIYFYSYNEQSQSHMFTSSHSIDRVKVIERSMKYMGVNPPIEPNTELAKFVLYHMLTIGVFEKLLLTRHYQQRKELISPIKDFLIRFFPDWAENKNLKKYQLIICQLYLGQHIGLADLLWYYPKLIKRAIKSIVQLG